MKCLTSIFKMKYLNKFDTILGVKVKKYSGCYVLCQSHYIEKMPLGFNNLQIKETNTPFNSSMKILENSGRSIAQLQYASAIVLG